MRPKIMRPNSGDTGLISDSNIETARKDFANLGTSEDLRNSTNLQYTTANLDKNKDLNRYGNNLLPYDATRVKLLPLVNCENTREIVQSGNGGSGNGNNATTTTCPPSDQLNTFFITLGYLSYYIRKEVTSYKIHILAGYHFSKDLCITVS